MKGSRTLPGSFRDPSGFLFSLGGQLYRQVNQVYQPHYDQLLASGLYHELVKAGLLIPHEEVVVECPEPARAYKIIQPERIPFVSYPYEWSFSQLRDAALATLEIQQHAMAFDMSLKDSSAYNIQFRGCRPVLIDSLSFEHYREGAPWMAYRQFCQHFLAPLALMAHKEIRLNTLLRLYIDGIPLDLASALLPARTRFDFALATHLHLHARSQRHFGARYAARRPRREMTRMQFRGLIDSLQRGVEKLTWEPAATEWADYGAETSYSARAWQHKIDMVSRFLAMTKPAMVWDLGANVGVFSRIATAGGALTVSADSDPGCVEINYRRCVQEGENRVLPLLLDLTNPSPGIGWENEERSSFVDRGPADVVLALALIHHLAISNNVPLARIAGFFARSGRWLIAEFVPKNDRQVQRMLMTREDIFPGYTQAGFEEQFRSDFLIHESVQLEDSDRSLYLMERRSSRA
jgi:hypothetical protein